MQVVYNGPHPEVVVDELDQEQVITAGRPVEIADELAARLLEQSTWALAGPQFNQTVSFVDAEPTSEVVDATDTLSTDASASEGSS